MGNDFAKPSAKSIIKPHLFDEYIDAKLSDVKEAYEYIGGSREGISRKKFEDTFSVLFKDCDPHFTMFEKSAILSQLPASQRDEDDQPEGTVNPAVVCTILSLLSKDSVEKKFMFLYELHFDNKNDMEVNIKGMTDTLIKGMLAVFKISKIPSKDIQYASVFTSLRTIRNSQRLQNEVDEVENNNEDVLTMSDFFQLCQESHVVSKLLNAILHLCAKQQVVQATEQPTTQLESKLVSTEVR